MLEVTGPKLGEWLVAVQISRVHRRTIIVPVRAANKTNAEAEARAVARQQMDQDAGMTVAAEVNLPWSLDAATATVIIPPVGP